MILDNLFAKIIIEQSLHSTTETEETLTLQLVIPTVLQHVQTLFL